MTTDRRKSSSFASLSPSIDTGRAYLCANTRQRQRQQFQNTERILRRKIYDWL